MMIENRFSVTRPLAGGRRRRYMESADFNGAAAHIFNGLKRAVADRAPIGPVLFPIEMDVNTPGNVSSILTLKSRPIGVAGGVALQTSEWLNHDFQAIDLVAYLTSVPGAPAVPSASKLMYIGLKLLLRSRDSVAITTFITRHDAGKKMTLAYCPLQFQRALVDGQIWQ